GASSSRHTRSKRDWSSVVCASDLYQILLTSVQAAEGLPALRDLLRGRASVLTGPSGVGKSSLMNALHPGLNLRIGEISSYWGKGKHTTRAALLDRKSVV